MNRATQLTANYLARVNDGKLEQSDWDSEPGISHNVALSITPIFSSALERNRQKSTHPPHPNLCCAMSPSLVALAAHLVGRMWRLHFPPDPLVSTSPIRILLDRPIPCGVAQCGGFPISRRPSGRRVEIRRHWPRISDRALKRLDGDRGVRGETGPSQGPLFG